MRLKIATKIVIGFSIMVAFVIINAVLTGNALKKNHDMTEVIDKVYAPSVDLIGKLYADISDSRMLIKSWVHIDKIADTPDKIKLRQLHSTGYNLVMDSLLALSEHWDSTNHKQLLNEINLSISDTLFDKHQYIMKQLNSFVAYEDPFVVFEVTPMVEDKGEVMEITKTVLMNINMLLVEQEQLIADKRNQANKEFDGLSRFIYLMLLALILVAVIISVILIRSLSIPINRTKNVLQSISLGILPDSTLKEGSDEIGQMARALHSVIRALRNISTFATEIGKGNFASEFKPLSDDDVLGLSLLEMRGELKKAKSEEEKRAQENIQRTWSSQGVALFSDILRKNNDNIEELTFEIISNMVKYTKSNQGGVFIVNDNDPENKFLEMTACYAYDRQKFISKKIEVGEGLVGRCYQEQEKIFITDIPNDYIKISSGLGEENPNCLLLVPLAYNDNIFGIMEIASFNVLANFEVEFIERIGESIAATISSVKANIQTQTLLEQSQQQAEEMSAQEEEMRQNMEELRATQEQSARKETELQKELEDLKSKLVI